MEPIEPLPEVNHTPLCIARSAKLLVINQIIYFKGMFKKCTSSQWLCKDLVILPSISSSLSLSLAEPQRVGKGQDVSY